MDGIAHRDHRRRTAAGGRRARDARARDERAVPDLPRARRARRSASSPACREVELEPGPRPADLPAAAAVLGGVLRLAARPARATSRPISAALGRPRARDVRRGRRVRRTRSSRACRGRPRSCSARSSPPPTPSRRRRSPAGSACRAASSPSCEGESLINDATAITAYRVAVVAITAGTFSALGGGRRSSCSARPAARRSGSRSAGSSRSVRERLDDPPVEITISLFTAYAAYLPAEELGLSGVIAAVTVGLYMGSQTSRVTNAQVRMQGVRGVDRSSSSCSTRSCSC